MCLQIIEEIFRNVIFLLKLHTIVFVKIRSALSTLKKSLKKNFGASVIRTDAAWL